MKSKETIIGVLALVLLVGGVFFLLSKTTRPSASTVPHSKSMSESPATASTQPTEANKVNIKGFAYAPTALKIKKGTTITWTNLDEAHHTVTSDSGSPAGGPSGPLMAKGETYNFTFNTVGTFKYHCDPHPYMHGTVEVTE